MKPTQEFRRLVLAALQAHEGDLRAQADAVADVTWRYVEKTCRTPVSQRGPGRRQQDTRRTA